MFCKMFVIAFSVNHKFNEMVARAFSKPKNSKEFLDLGDYMLHASTIFMQEMIETVKYLSSVACDLSLYAVLPKELWKAHASSVAWIQKSSHIFIRYSTIYEAEKSKGEENMGKTISKLNYDLDTFEPSLTFLDRIDDINKLYEYKLVI